MILSYLRRFYFLIIFILFVALLIYRNVVAGQSIKKLETAMVSQGNLEEKLTISGSIDAEEKVVLRFQTSGRLAWVGVKEGDLVKKFQTIASLDQREIKKKMENELLDYMKTRWDFEEAKRETYRDKLFTDSIKRILEKNQFDLDKSIHDVELQKLAVEYASLWTPIEGLVVRIDTPYAGVNISPTSSEFEIVNPKSVFFSATADQTEVTKIKEGFTGILLLDAYPEATLSGTVNKISFLPKSDETGTVYKILFDFENDNTDYKYRIGMAGDLSLITQRKENVLFLPSKFINTQNGKKYVNTKRKNKTERIEITTGMETDDNIEITTGISHGETVYD